MAYLSRGRDLYNVKVAVIRYRYSYFIKFVLLQYTLGAYVLYALPYILGLTLHFDNSLFEGRKKLLSLSHSWSFLRHLEFKMVAIFYPVLQLSKMISHIYGHVIYRWIANLVLIHILIGNKGPKCPGK